MCLNIKVSAYKLGLQKSPRCPICVMIMSSLRQKLQDNMPESLISVRETRTTIIEHLELYSNISSGKNIFLPPSGT